MTCCGMNYCIEPKDTPEQRQAKLYLAVISMGEWLYQQGAAITEMNKEYLAWEKELDTMRQELRLIRQGLNTEHEKGASNV